MGLRAILVCVDFGDLLSITLPYNRHHFDEVMVVTHPRDLETQRVALANRCNVYATDAFYRDGADFNKWLALEEGLDRYGRDGWLCLMDADVLWPRSIPTYESWRHVAQRRADPSVPYAPDPGEAIIDCDHWDYLTRYALEPGHLYTPRRRMWADWPSTASWSGRTRVDPDTMIPDESYWGSFPLHPQDREFAGYTQIFHASDPVLGDPPWHDTSWRHCGGADSFFQAKWKEENKIRPPWEVLHLGPAGTNWCGRVTPRLDGATGPVRPPSPASTAQPGAGMLSAQPGEEGNPRVAAERVARLRAYLLGRRGRTGPERFDPEKLPPREGP